MQVNPTDLMPEGNMDTPTNDVQGTPEPEAPEGSQVPEGTEEPAGDNWEVRARYHQSRADKLQAELERLKQESAAFEVWKPIISKLQSDPQVLGKLTGVAEGTEAAPPLEKPKPPKKPKGYSKFEALNDPESESAKYEEALLDYQEKLLEYYEKRDAMREAELRQVEEMKALEAQQQAFVQETYNKVQAEYGLSPAEATEFISFMSSPDSIELDNLVRYFKFLKSQKRKGEPPVPPKTPGNEPPPPASAGGSTSGTPADTSEIFVKDLKRTGRNLFEVL